MRIAKVAVEAATYAIDKPYSYTVPDDMMVSVGCRVLVPFGRGNRTSEGMVLSVEMGEPAKPLKSLRLNLDNEPLTSQSEIKLALWMRQRYFCTFYDAIRTILPAAVWYQHRTFWRTNGAELKDLSEKESEVCHFLAGEPKETNEIRDRFGESVTTTLYALKNRGVLEELTESHRKIQDKVLKIVRLTVPLEEALDKLSPKRKSAREAVCFLGQYGETALPELSYFTGASRPVIAALERHGIVSFYEKESYRITEKEYAVEATAITLNDEQQKVYDDVLKQINTRQPGVTLLHGITGSGKTLIYIRLAQTITNQGKSVMILVPEIALTPQMMARFSAYFGDQVALLHSGLRMTERYDQWKRIRKGEACVVLGTRSAIFAPLQNIGLIVMDEEQEGSYQSESTPCYHARDIAKYLVARDNARLLLGSATPTIESAYAAYRGDYQLSVLRKRYNNHNLPQVIITDMAQVLRSGNLTSISGELYEELKQNISRGEQSILFINRRGTNRQLLCVDCSYVPQCPRCSVYLTYHSANRRLMCHYCGYSERGTEVCPECGGPMKHIGTGTQKVVEELQTLFPDTEVLRMDADTVNEGHEIILRRFSEEKVPILLGTQMVAKGLDFENVTLVGVLAADMSLYADHYRSAERTFNLLTQVVGRAGRGEKAGRAVIQTFTPKNDVIMAAAQQDYQRFYDSEIRLRELRRDPPFADIFTITVVGNEETRVRYAAETLCQNLRYAVKTKYFMDVDVIGSAPCNVVKVNNRFRYRITVVGKNEKRLRDLLADYMRDFTLQAKNRNLSVFANCNLMD